MGNSKWTGNGCKLPLPVPTQMCCFVASLKSVDRTQILSKTAGLDRGCDSKHPWIRDANYLNTTFDKHHYKHHHQQERFPTTDRMWSNEPAIQRVPGTHCPRTKQPEAGTSHSPHLASLGIRNYNPQYACKIIHPDDELLQQRGEGGILHADSLCRIFNQHSL